MDIGAKLRQLRKLRKKTLMDVERGTGMNNGNVSKIERGELGMSEETIKKFAAFYNVSLSELFDNVEERSTAVELTEISSRNLRSFAAIDATDRTIVSFDVMSIDGISQAGLGNITGKKMYISIDSLRYIKADPASVVGLFSSDDGMANTIMKYDQVLIDTTSTDVTMSGGIYAILYDDSIVIRKLYKKPGGSILLICENKNYPEILATKDDLEHIKIIGKVVYRGGRIPIQE